MGTRCLTVFRDDGREIAVLYRQFDGYPSGHGVALAKFLSNGDQPRKLVNGFSMAETSRPFNGMGCLAAECVGHFKLGQERGPIGGFYLYPANTRDVGEEYVYLVEPYGDGDVRVHCADACDPKKHRSLFVGNVRDFAAWSATYEEGE